MKTAQLLINTMVSGLLAGLAGLAFGGPGEQVDVRVLDRSTGAVLAADRVTVEARLAFDHDDHGERYLGFHRERLRGQDVLEISLADAPEKWDRVGYAVWRQPGRHVLNEAGLMLEIAPVGWADRFCRELAGIEEPAVRETALAVRDSTGMHISAPGWDGEGRTPLRSLADPDSAGVWHADLGEDDMLRVVPPDSDAVIPVGPVRPDFPMQRDVDLPSGLVEVAYTPSGHASVFCERYAADGAAYAAAMEDYLFGRAGNRRQ